MSRAIGVEGSICAQATPSGRGGIGIVRVSGPLCTRIAEALLGALPPPRHALYGPIRSREGETLDLGIALYFPGPDSFTGEDVLELHCHGGPVLVDAVLAEVLALGARPARPGEFSERAFLNGKLDLAQAEAIADLIDSGSRQAARLALHSLQGEFSRLVHRLVAAITELRVYVEAAMDFPEEEVDFLADDGILQRLSAIRADLAALLRQAAQGRALREGLSVVIAGAPNAGKSSLLNALSGADSAIVTAIPGTTRDTLREEIFIDGMPLHVIDTAGLRDSEDPVEQEGIRRAWREIGRADRVLLVLDASTSAQPTDSPLWPELLATAGLERLTVLRNKIDLSGEAPSWQAGGAGAPEMLSLSARDGQGLDLLKEHLKRCAGLESGVEGRFMARRRHLDALERASRSLAAAEAQLLGARAGELLAEDLREAQQALGEITGEVSSDDLLGHIFSSFCIGK